jgi:hypothetical protein
VVATLYVARERLLIGENEERWKRLCEQAAKEQDRKKLIELVNEINELLDAKQKRLAGNPPPKT